MLVTRTLTNIGDPLVSPDGSVLSGVLVNFTLVTPLGKVADAWDTISKERIVGSVSAITDGAGEFSVQLWPTDRSNVRIQYLCHVEATGIRDFYASLPSGLTSFQWADLQASSIPLTAVQLDVLDAYRADFDASALAAAQSAANILAIFSDAAAIASAVQATNADRTQTNLDRNAAALSASQASDLLLSAGFVLVKDNMGAVTSVANAVAQLTSVAANLASVIAVSSNATNVNSVAGNAANITAVAGILAKVTQVADSLAKIDSVLANSANINSVAGNKTNVDLVANNSAAVTSVAGATANMTTIVANLATLNTVVAAKANVDAVAVNLGNVNAVATNLSAIQNAGANAASAAASAAVYTDFQSAFVKQSAALIQTQAMLAQRYAFTQ